MNRFVKAALNPSKSYYEATSRISPTFYWHRFLKRSRKAGLKKPYLCLSFDCDTKEDAAVVGELNAKLNTLGIRPAYAVPGELLEQNLDEYKSILKSGACFLNHGYKTHTVWNSEMQNYESIFFYDTLPRNTVREDIRLGHESLARFLGTPPRGFRAPHFGTFQRPGELRFLRQTLHELGYEYSSSTCPVHVLSYGPISHKGGIAEIPVTGIASRPWQIYDSWGFFSAPSRRLTAADYLTEAKRMVQMVKETKFVGILNYYADPSHVWNRAEFFEAFKSLMGVCEYVDLKDLPKLTTTA